MSVFEPVNVIYDGQCAFCIRSLKLFRAVDFMHVLNYYDAHDESRISATFPELGDAAFDNAMFVVSESRKVSRGFFCVSENHLEQPSHLAAHPRFLFSRRRVCGGLGLMHGLPGIA